MAQRADERETALSVFLSFVVTCTAASRMRASFFLLLFFFPATQYGTRARMSQGGRNVLFGHFYLLSRAGTSGQLTRPRKNGLPFAFVVLPSVSLHSPVAAQITRKSRYVSATRARINNGVNERRVSHSADFLSAIRPGAFTVLVRSSLESTSGT